MCGIDYRKSGTCFQAGECSSVAQADVCLVSCPFLKLLLALQLFLIGLEASLCWPNLDARPRCGIRQLGKRGRRSNWRKVLPVCRSCGRGGAGGICGGGDRYFAARRAETMFKLRELVDANRRRIAELITLEHGKTLPDAMGEVARGLENIEFACGIPQMLEGRIFGTSEPRRWMYQIRQPLGVVAGITPFNFPAMVPMWMFANAIACGNSFILKPSERDPSVSLYLAELIQKAGVPDGVFTVLQGDKVAVDRLLEHPDVKAISLRRIDAGGEVHLRNGDAQRRKSVCRRWAARRIMW